MVGENLPNEAVYSRSFIIPILEVGEYDIYTKKWIFNKDLEYMYI